MTNRLISIGYLGSKRVYLNISREEAIRRYREAEGLEEDDGSSDLDHIDEFEFNNEFWAYEVGPSHD